jgi:hypothetical protein
VKRNPTLEDATVRQLLDEICRRAPSVVVAVYVPEDGQQHYTITRWTGSGIIAAGMIRALQLDVDAELATNTNEETPGIDDDDE